MYMKAAVKKHKRKRNLFLRVAMAAFAVYIVVVLVQLQMEISSRQKKLDELQTSVAAMQTENEELQNQADNSSQYLEKKAREQGMARPGETIYIQIPGN